MPLTVNDYQFDVEAIFFKSGDIRTGKDGSDDEQSRQEVYLLDLTCMLSREFTTLLHKLLISDAHISNNWSETDPHSANDTNATHSSWRLLLTFLA